MIDFFFFALGISSGFAFALVLSALIFDRDLK
jgi:hypothetical protein